MGGRTHFIDINRVCADFYDFLPIFPIKRPFVEISPYIHFFTDFDDFFTDFDDFSGKSPL